MLYINEIRKVLKVSQKLAEQVMYVMECSAFDFSEATATEFKREAQFALAEIS